MSGVALALLLKGFGVIVIIGGIVLLTRLIERAEDRFPPGRLKRFLFFKVGDGDITDPPGDPGARARERAKRQSAR